MPCRHPSRRGRGVGGRRFVGVLPKDHTEVVLGLGDQTVGVDELERVTCLERIPLLHVAVDEHCPFGIVGGHATLGAHHRMIDGSSGARLIELGPRGGDEIDQPRRLLCAGR
jgi:hypothetical protein